MWYAYDGLWPFSGRVDDQRLAYELATIAQLQTGGKLRLPPKPDLSRTPWSSADFLIDRRLRRQAAVQPAAPRVRGPSMADVAAIFGQAGIAGRPA